MPSLLFNPGAFAFTAGALLLAPIAAELNVFRSYTPFLLLRFWMIGFCVYGIVLAQRARGLRIAWRVIYSLLAIPFAFVWKIPVEQWALIDVVSATLVGMSAIFLRTEPRRPGAAA